MELCISYTPFILQYIINYFFVIFLFVLCIIPEYTGDGHENSWQHLYEIY